MPGELAVRKRRTFSNTYGRTFQYFVAALDVMRKLLIELYAPLHFERFRRLQLKNAFLIR